MNNLDIGALLKAYYNYEGWWGVYKRNWHKVKHNYRLKLTLKKRFGESRKQMIINNLKDEPLYFRDVPKQVYGSSIVVNLSIDTQN